MELKKYLKIILRYIVSLIKSIFEIQKEDKASILKLTIGKIEKQ